MKGGNDTTHWKRHGLRGLIPPEGPTLYMLAGIVERCHFIVQGIFW